MAFGKPRNRFIRPKPRSLQSAVDKSRANGVLPNSAGIR